MAVDRCAPSRLELFVASALEGFSAAPLPSEPLLQVRLVAGAELVGLRIELKPTDLPSGCLEFETLIGFVPHGDGDARWEVAPRREDDSWVFEFPEARLSVPSLGPAGPVGEPTGETGAAALEERLLAENRASFAALPRGRALAVAEGELRVSVTALASEQLVPPSVALPLPVLIEEQARRPLLPPGAPQPHDDPLLASHLRALDAVYAAADYAVFWLAFDGTREARQTLLAGPLWRWAGRLALLVAELSQGASLSAVLSAGGCDHGWPDALSAGGEGLSGPRWAEARALVEAGGALRLDAGAGGLSAEAGYLLVSHAQLGDPLRSRTVRAAPFPPPLELVLAWPQPDEDAACARLVAIFSEVLAEATAEASCVGALATATGLPPGPGEPLVYELLAGLEASARDVRVLARRPRAPGWRVLVPAAAVARLAPEGPLVRRRDVSAGALVGSDAPDPFCLDDEDRAAIEAALLSCFAPATDGP